MFIQGKHISIKECLWRDFCSISILFLADLLQTNYSWCLYQAAVALLFLEEHSDPGMGRHKASLQPPAPPCAAGKTHPAASPPATAPCPGWASGHSSSQDEGLLGKEGGHPIIQD